MARERLYGFYVSYIYSKSMFSERPKLQRLRHYTVLYVGSVAWWQQLSAVILLTWD